MNDFSKEFSKQRAKFFPYAIALAIMAFAIIIILPILFFIFSLSETFLIAYLIICLGILLVCIPSWLKTSTCPNCKKFMGRDLSKFCPVCGVRIKE